MLYRINPWEIVKSHFLTFYDFKSNTLCKKEIGFQIFFASLVAAVHVKYFCVDSTVVGIVVSVAALIAGLLLNVMVLIYTLLTAKNPSGQTPTTTDFLVKKIGKETLSNIAFSVLTSIALVVFTLLNLTDYLYLKYVGQFGMVFLGFILAITVMIVLIRFYRLMSYNVN